MVNISLLIQDPFLLLCEVDVSCETSQLNSVLRVLPWQLSLSLRQVVLDVIQPPLLRSSSPSLSRHLHHHHPLAHIFFFSSQYIYYNTISTCASSPHVSVAPKFLSPLNLGYTLFCLLIFSPLSSIALLHSSSLFSTSSLLVLHNTMSSTYKAGHRSNLAFPRKRGNW